MDNSTMEKEYYYIQKPEKKRRKWPWIFILLILTAAIGSLFYKTGFIFSQMQTDNEGAVLPISEDWPEPEIDPDRTNILLLGLRGAGDDNGGLLTDTIILLSIKKSTSQVAMISIPRDLYVVMPQAPGQKNILKEKINFAYALGEERKAGGGIVYSKAVVSRLTNLYIDYAISADFEAFKEIVDILGGIDVNLEAPFSEKTQFAKEFIVDLPAGKNHLDGDTALFFVRARYSTSDFDRARRQQKVLMAIKNKAFSLGIMLNPAKVFEILNSLGRHVKTDMKIGEINSFISMAGKIDSNIRQKVFDNGPEGLLYSSTTEKGAYILLPVGDNFDRIQETCRDIFQ